MLSNRQEEAVLPSGSPPTLRPGAATSILIKRHLGRLSSRARQRLTHQARQRDVLQPQRAAATDAPLILVDDTRHADPNSQSRRLHGLGHLAGTPISSACAQGGDHTGNLLRQPMTIRVTPLRETAFQAGDDTPSPIGNNRGDAVGTDGDPQRNSAFLGAGALGKVCGMSHVFSVLGGRAASPRDHHPTRWCD